MAIRIGFLGPEGTFTEEALEKYLAMAGGGSSFIKMQFSSIPELMYALSGEIDMAVVPVENSLEGSVNITLDMLIHEVEVKIKGEIVLPIRQNLLAKKEIPLEAVETVYSHPQAIFQSRKFLSEHLPRAVIKDTLSTSEAARIVSELGGNAAAIGGRRLCRIYGLKVLAEDIQGCKNNMTRFFVLSSSDEKRTGRDKTAIVFSTENRPGSLFNSLKVFAERGLNLTKIESRPSRRTLGEYVFFMEVEGHREDNTLKEALEKLKSHTNHFKILGSYPVGDYYPLYAEGDRKASSYQAQPVVRGYPPAGGEMVG